MKPVMPPFNRFIQTILEEDRFPGSTVIVDLDANSYEDLPLVSWTFLNSGQRDYGLWGGILAVNVICVPRDAEDLLSHVYAQVHAWGALDKGELPGVGLGVETVADQAVFNIVSQAVVNGKHVAQFSGQFGLTIRDYS